MILFRSHKIYSRKDIDELRLSWINLSSENKLLEDEVQLKSESRHGFIDIPLIIKDIELRISNVSVKLSLRKYHKAVEAHLYQKLKNYKKANPTKDWIKDQFMGMIENTNDWNNAVIWLDSMT